MKLTNARFKPPSALTVKAKDCNALVYVYERAGRPLAIAYQGNAQRPTWHFSFRNAERRAEKIREFFASVKAAEDSRKQRKAEKKAFVHSLKVGDILNTSWGYDQTNVEFFQVTRLIGASMVEVRELAQQTEESAFMSGTCAPIPGQYCGKPLRKRVLAGNMLDIHGGFGYAHVYEMREIVPGVKVGAPQHFSSYH